MRTNNLVDSYVPLSSPNWKYASALPTLFLGCD
jgi:hypothetical protein